MHAPKTCPYSPTPDKNNHHLYISVSVSPTQAGKMDKVMEKSFDVLEAALSQLVESISSYNPSPMAASTVVVADDEISKSLELRMLCLKNMKNRTENRL